MSILNLLSPLRYECIPHRSVPLILMYMGHMGSDMVENFLTAENDKVIDFGEGSLHCLSGPPARGLDESSSRGSGSCTTQQACPGLLKGPLQFAELQRRRTLLPHLWR